MTQNAETLRMDAIARLRATMDSATLAEFRQPEQMLLKMAMERCGMEDLPQTNGDMDRASGEMICEKCGQEFFAHPLDWREIGYGNVPFLNILCDGTWVKL